MGHGAPPQPPVALLTPLRRLHPPFARELLADSVEALAFELVLASARVAVDDVDARPRVALDLRREHPSTIAAPPKVKGKCSLACASVTSAQAHLASQARSHDPATRPRGRSALLERVAASRGRTRD